MTRRLAQLAETWGRWPDGWIARSSMMSIVIMISIVITMTIEVFELVVTSDSDSDRMPPSPSRKGHLGAGVSECLTRGER